MLGRRTSLARAGSALAMGVALFVSLAFLPTSAAGAPPQVTIYLGGYGQAPNTAPPPVGAALPPASANGGLQGEATLAQIAAYQQYLMYLSVAGSQPARDPSQYFTNGAAVTSVPSAGPGSAYFSNGAEATRLAPTPTPAPTAAPPSTPPLAALPAPEPLAPWWWVDNGAPPPATPAPAPATSAAPAPAAAPPSEALTVGPAMSFEEWLQTMGASVPEAEAAEGEPTLAENALVAEPSATANDVRQRAAYSPPEKPREHVAASAASRGWAALIGGAFAVGLLLGGLAMWRVRPGASAATSDVPPGPAAR